MWTQVIAMTTVAYAAASYAAAAAGWSPSKSVLILLTIAWIAFGTCVNTVGQWVLKVFSMASVCAEMLASVVFGTVLLVAYRVNPISVLWNSFGASSGGSFHYVTMSWLGAVAIIGFSFLGYEASGAIAEEVKEPERTVPWTILIVLLAVGAVVIYTTLAWILAVPHMKAAMNGSISDPMVDTLRYHFGNYITTPILCLITLGFTASMVALQTVGSRTLFSFARDRMIPMHHYFVGLGSGTKLPKRAIVFVGCIASIIMLINLAFERVYNTLISFTVGGFYLAFTFPVAAALFLHIKHRHVKGPFNLGRFSFVVTLVAFIWLVFELTNVVWPRSPGLPWYEDYGTLLMIGVLGILGAVAYWKAPSHESKEMM
jgi:amino acid transporter